MTIRECDFFGHDWVKALPEHTIGPYELMRCRFCPKSHWRKIEEVPSYHDKKDD